MVDYLDLILPLVIEYKYLAVFLALTVAGCGVPIPEELTIVVSGYLAAIGQMDFWMTLFICYLGVLSGDLVTYFTGKYAGRWFLGSRLMRWLVSRKKLAQAQFYYRRYGPRALLVARQAPGLRYPTFFTAGMLNMRLMDFILYDSVAGLISMPLAYLISYYFGPRITETISLVTQIGNITTISVLTLLVLGGAGYYFYYKYYKN